MRTRKCHADANGIRTKNNMSPAPSVGGIIKDQITSLVEAYINVLLKDFSSEASSGSLYCLFDLCFMALHHLYGHFGRWQLT